MYSQFRKIINLKRVRLVHEKYTQNDDCIKLNLVQVHTSNGFQCIGKHKLFEVTNGQFL